MHSKPSNKPEDYLELISRPFYAEVINRFRGKLRERNWRGKKILDIGSGAGHAARAAGCSNTVVSMDLDFNVLDPDSGPCVVGDMLSLPFGDETFDAAVCLTALHHAPPRRLEQVLNEIARTLKTNGELLLCEPRVESVNLVYYNIRKFLSALAGMDTVTRLIGYFEAGESPVSTPGLMRLLSKKFESSVEIWFPLRLPPLKMFSKSEIETRLNPVLERSPFLGNLGTYIFIKSVKLNNLSQSS